MERYSEYKDSGVKWLGEIPSHWEVVRIKNVANMFGRIGFRGYTADDLVEEGAGAITLSPTNIIDGELDFTNCSYLSWNKYYESPEIMVKAGDVVLVKTASVGKCALVRSLPKETTVNPQFLVFKNIVANSAFFTYILQDYIQCFLDSEKNGSTIPTISQQIIGNFKIMLPPRTEQDSIVRYLDAATSKIDKAIAMQQKMIDLLNERKQIIIQNAVTKGLDENVEMKDSGVEWIGMIPKHWEILKLKRCASIKTGTTPPTNERKYFDGGRISWFTPGDLNDLHLKFASKTITQKAIDDKVGRLFPAKTIYFVGIGATVAKVSACDFAASSNQQINAIICNESLDYIFATYVLKSEQEFIRNMANYVTLPIINQSDTGLIDMIVPPKSEQQAIVAYLGKEMQRFDSAISNCQRQITLLQERKQIIINEVVTGKVKVS